MPFSEADDYIAYGSPQFNMINDKHVAKSAVGGYRKQRLAGKRNVGYG